MEVPDTPAVFQDSRRETVSIMDRLVEQGSTEVQLTAMSDSASLVALSAQTLLEVLETFSPLLYETVPQAPRPFPATGEGDQTQEAQQNHLCTQVDRALLVLNNIRTVAQNTRKKYQSNHINTSLSPITPLYAITPEHISTNVTDSSLKNIPVFTGEVQDSPAQLQEFLRAVYDVASVHKLTRGATVRILQRKCSSVARVLLDEFIKDLKIDDEDTLLKIALFFESKWSLSWSPALARAQLTALQRSHQNCQNFSSLQANILRLSHLASLDQPEAARAEFVTANQLSTFTACLSRQDQSILLKSGSERAAQSLPPHDLASAVNTLLNHHASRSAHQQAKSLFDKQESMLGNPASEQAMYGGQEGTASTPRRAESRSRQRQRFSSVPARRPESRQPSRQPPRREESRRPPRRDESRGRGGRHPQQAREQSRRPSDRAPASSRRQEDGKQVYHTTETAGVPKGHCIRCSSPSHLMTSDKCRFANTPLPPTPCKQAGVPGSTCKGGAHYSRFCRQITPSRTSGRGSRGSRPQGPRSARGRGGPAARLHQPPEVAFAARDDDNDAAKQYYTSQ